MKAFLRVVWNWSFVVTLPLCCGYAWWAIGTWRSFSTFGVRYDTTPSSYTLEETGRERLGYMMRELSLAFLPAGGGATTRPVRTINLFVPETGLAALDARLPDSGFDSVRGTLMQGDRSWSVSVRYRGDFVSHWGDPKKSWRVRTRRRSLFEGMRDFNLLAPKYPEQLNNHLGYQLAERMGLLAPRSELVELVLNGRRRGLHLLVEQPDESTLRRNGRMPGDIYSGELIARDSWRGIPNAVWDQPSLWEKDAINNHYPETARTPLLALANLANGYPSPALQAEISNLLDVEAWGRFLAYETLTQCLHFDRSHNWRLYYDSNRGVFLPLIWDPVAWAPASRVFGATELDMMASRLQTLLLMNGDFLRARHRALAAFFESGKATAFLDEVRASLRDAAAALARDPFVRPPDAGHVEREMRSFHASIRTVFDDVRWAFLGDRGSIEYAEVGDVEGERVLHLRIAGRQPLGSIDMVWSRNLGAQVEASLELLGADGRWRVQTVPVTVRGSTTRLRLGLVTPVGRVFRSPLQLLQDGTREARPLTSRLRLRGLDAGQRLLDMRCERGGLPAVAQPREELAVEPVEMLFRAAEQPRAGSALVWSGEVRVEGVREIRADLLIEAGTTVRLLPGANLRLGGRLLAEGESDRPIRFLPEGSADPWGAVVLEGHAADGSRLRHCEFVGGSGWKGDMSEFSGMLSIHGVDDVSLEHCVFRDNRRVDDVVHAVYSRIVFRDCVFQRAFSDALDLDICLAEIVRCRFEGSSNDGVDLMTSRCTIVDSVFVDNRDKGVSVGEGSHLLALGDVFDGNVIGVQVKDGSVAGIYNCDFTHNGLALDAYKKIWRYDDGGRGYVDKCRISENAVGIQADGASRFHVRDSYLDSPPELRRRYLIEPSVDDRQRDRAAAGPPTLPPELEVLGTLGSKAWRRLRPDRRGTGS